MKVIFLDVDGVLNSDEYFDKIKNLNIDGIQSEIDVEKIKMLNMAINETGAKIVLTSSWRYTRNAQELKKLLSEYGIPTDSTPFIQNKRGLEIKQYLLENPDVENFIIVDDELFDSYDDELIKKLVKISNGNGHNFGEGLLPKDIDEIIKRLRKSREEYDKKIIEQKILDEQKEDMFSGTVFDLSTGSSSTGQIDAKEAAEKIEKVKHNPVQKVFK